VKSTDKQRKNGRKRKSDHYLNLMLAVTLVLVAVLGSVLLYVKFKESRKLDLSLQYSVKNNLETDVTDSDLLQTASGFAADLCVSSGVQELEGVALTAASEKALLFNLDTNTSLYAQGIYDKAYPASITKIMTALMALKYGDMSDEVTITAEDVNLEEGSQVSGMIPGDTVTMDSLFHALMVHSDNDAAMAIAEHIGGTVDNFVAMMNEEARNLGMTGTHFMNPHGLHDENHYTTAYDIYLMLNTAYKYQEFYDVMQMKAYNLTVNRADGTQTTLRLDSTDKYLTGEKEAPANVTVIGGKTGTTSSAGACLAIISQNAYGQPFISVVLNAQNKGILYKDMNLLLEQINK
jgi:D-alanyl-D-alanine carboxypeptidase